jgi:hypothetical protein
MLFCHQRARTGPQNGVRTDPRFPGNGVGQSPRHIVMLLGAPIKGRDLVRCLPVPLGAGTVLGSHSCGALPPVTARGLYHQVP